MILGGDIGGTKSNLALFRNENGRLEIICEEKYSSQAHSSLEEIIEKFLKARPAEVSGQKISAAAFGVAGPVVADVCITPNLAWKIRASDIQELVGVEKVKLLNDLEANGYGIPLLEKSQVVSLNEGEEQPDGHGALIAAGTGLGEAFLYRSGKDCIPIASEGGHASFAPRNELEIELLRYLLGKWSHVSFERVLSGPGLFNVYTFLRDSGRGKEPDWLAEKIGQGDPTAAVSEAAMARTCALCVEALDLFITIYGGEAGNLALKSKATGGVYVGGGIAPRILERLQQGKFMQAFREKGRMASMIEKMPVRVIKNPKTALLGAGRLASLL